MVRLQKDPTGETTYGMLNIMIRGKTKAKKWIEAVDCRRNMAAMEDNSVSLILTDPPYFLDGMDDNWDRAKLDGKKPSKGVVTSLPAGMKFSTDQGTNLHSFLLPIAREWNRILRPGGFGAMFFSE